MGLTHLDAGVVIGFLDGNDAHHAAATAALAVAVDGGDRLAVSASAFAECLVGPARHGADATTVVVDLFERLPIEVVPVDATVAATAARLRASHRTLRLPDAFVVATAIEARADQLITTDHRWPTARSLGLSAHLTQL